MTASMYDEYRFLKAFPAYTHDGETCYLDASPTHVRWMLEIDSIVSAAEAAAARSQQ